MHCEWHETATKLQACEEKGQRTCVVKGESPGQIVFSVSIRAVDGTAKASTLGLCYSLPEIQKWAAIPDPLQTISLSVFVRQAGCISWTWD